MGKLFLFQYIFMKDIPPGRLRKKIQRKRYTRRILQRFSRKMKFVPEK